MLDLIRSCVHFILQSSNGANQKDFSSVQKILMWTKRTAKLHGSHGNTDITELMVIDEMTQCEMSTEYKTEGTSFGSGSILFDLSAEKAETWRETTKQVMQFAVAKSMKTRSCRISHSRKPRLSICKAPFPESTENKSQVVQKDG